MNKTQIFSLIGVIIIIITIAIFIIVPRDEPITEVVEVVEVVQDNMLQRLIDEPGLDKWRLSSFDNDTTFFLTVEFDSIKEARVEITRNFDTPSELSENIDSILKEARLLK